MRFSHTVVRMSYRNILCAEVFSTLAEAAAWHTKGILQISVHPPIVTGYIDPPKGFSRCKFIADFNDDGQITGNYTYTCEDKNSKILEAYLERLKKAIQLFMQDDNYDNKGKFVNEELFIHLNCTIAEKFFLRRNFNHIKHLITRQELLQTKTKSEIIFDEIKAFMKEVVHCLTNALKILRDHFREIINKLANKEEKL